MTTWQQWLLATLLGLATACVAAPATTGAALHTGDELRQIMRRMNALAYERNLPELEVDKQRLANAIELARIAGQLAGDSAALRPPSAADEAARREFSTYAARLAAEAEHLGELAQARRYTELGAQMERVSHQCAACHLRFRPR
ncbi:MAG: hypothetical protein ACU85V_07060 [Gammaproteobacteria bacterium]